MEKKDFRKDVVKIINTNNDKSNKIFTINKFCKLFWFNSMKLLSINVKKVKNPKNSVILDRIIMKIFFFKNSNIFKNYSI